MVTVMLYSTVLNTRRISILENHVQKKNKSLCCFGCRLLKLKQIHLHKFFGRPTWFLLCLGITSSRGAQIEGGKVFQYWHQTRSVEGRGGSDKQKSKTVNTSVSLQCEQQQIPLEKQTGCVTESKLDKTALIWEFKL